MKRGGVQLTGVPLLDEIWDDMTTGFTTSSCNDNSNHFG
jgi:hypothetical protein